MYHHVELKSVSVIELYLTFSRISENGKFVRVIQAQKCSYFSIYRNTWFIFQELLAKIHVGFIYQLNFLSNKKRIKICV